MYVWRDSKPDEARNQNGLHTLEALSQSSPAFVLRRDGAEGGKDWGGERGSARKRASEGVCVCI